MRNHINADPKAKIVVVGHGKGIDFMLDGAEDKNKNPFNVTMEDLAAKGVEFRVCNNTLVSRKIDKSKVVPPATVVPSGVAEVARLQSEEGLQLHHDLSVKPRTASCQEGREHLRAEQGVEEPPKARLSCFTGSRCAVFAPRGATSIDTATTPISPGKYM